VPAIHRQPAPVSELGLRKLPSVDDVEVAMGHWGAVGAGREARRGAELLHRRAEVALPALPTVLTHGDCHTENIVQDASGRYRWIDWEQAHLGDGLDDLVFMWQRAEFAGASPPREAMLTAYTAARALRLSAETTVREGRAPAAASQLGGLPQLRIAGGTEPDAAAPPHFDEPMSHGPDT
jgi:hypothetical protein